MSAATEASATSAGPVALLSAAFRDAIARALGNQYAGTDPLIRRSDKPEFGDYQANFAMGLAKRIGGTNPRELAQKVIDTADLAAIANPPEVAGPGFINIRLKADALTSFLEAMDDESLGVPPDPDPHPIVIDMCSVNVAKQMHVGHLRSTIIGDALARVLERRGRAVIRQNHLGDWGLPIAMVLHYLRERGADLDSLTLADLDAAYREAQQVCMEDAELEAAKRTLVKLQQGDVELIEQWHKLIDVTMNAMYEACRTLGVELGPEHNRGESFYRDRLADVVDAFVRGGGGRVDDGAIVVDFEGRDRPLLIRKSDGGYLYSTTDVAAVRYRTHELNADRVIYVVDARQRDHFRDVFDAARKIGWNVTPDGREAELIHIPFGAVLGEDKRPLKTRSGENVTLRALLDEAVERGAAEVAKRAADPNAPTHGLSDDELRDIGRAVGIGAIKYADLSSDLVRDYVFNFDRMISFEGNTGPYIQYAHARICSMFVKAGIEPGSIGSAAIRIEADAERGLALALLGYGQTVADVAESLEPHRLCSYLFELAGAFASFYQHCPVLQARDDPTRQSRMRLCDLTRRVLADGLALLGIEAPQRM